MFNSIYSLNSFGNSYVFHVVMFEVKHCVQNQHQLDRGVPFVVDDCTEGFDENAISEFECGLAATGGSFVHFFTPIFTKRKLKKRTQS